MKSLLSVSAIAVALSMAGCSTIDAVGDRATDVNISMSSSNNDITLLNIIRAYHSDPLQFTTLSTFQGHNLLSGTIGFPTVTFGAYQTHAQHQTIFGPNPFQRSASNDFTVNPIDDPSSNIALTTPVTPETLGLLIEQGYSEQLLFYLFIDKIDVIDSKKLSPEEGDENVLNRESKVAAQGSDNGSEVRTSLVGNDLGTFDEFDSNIRELLMAGLTIQLDPTARSFLVLSSETSGVPSGSSGAHSRPSQAASLQAGQAAPAQHSVINIGLSSEPVSLPATGGDNDGDNSKKQPSSFRFCFYLNQPKVIFNQFRSTGFYKYHYNVDMAKDLELEMSRAESLSLSGDRCDHINWGSRLTQPQAGGLGWIVRLKNPDRTGYYKEYQITFRSIQGVYNALGKSLYIQDTSKSRLKSKISWQPAEINLLNKRAAGIKIPYPWLNNYSDYPDDNLIDVRRGKFVSCFASLWAYNSEWCVPSSATNTKEIFSILHQVFSWYTKPSTQTGGTANVHLTNSTGN